MKKRIIFTIWMALALVLTIARPVSADVILPNTHPVDRSVKIVNLNEFPDLVLIAYVRGPVDSWPTEQYLITNNMYLTKGTYKLNRLDILWEIQDKANPITLPLIPKNFAVENIEPYGGYVSDNSALVKQTIEYSIAGFSNGELVIFESKVTSEFNDGSLPKIETFDSPVPNATRQPPDPKPEPVIIGPTPPPTTITPTVIVPHDTQPPTTTTNSPSPAIVDVNAPEQPFLQSLSYEQKFLLALLLTLAVEIPAAVLLVRFSFKRRDISLSKIVLAGIFASGLTLPYLWFVLPSFISNSTLNLILGELSVFLVETFIYIWLLKLKSRQALAVSLIANAASMLLGFMLL